ncbi:protein LEAD-SENSITIVE 1-like [Miscanthus floridulus]|uniref:protein LEAD-SENSITIVE 1-like n=1 Tax=Miscanthus floridulus TaxID=154761 RepID=UPI0034597B5D
MDRGVTVISSRIERWQLRPGDHIFAWCSSHAKAFPHHGIYESHAKVIHFNAPLAQSSSFTGVFTRAVVAAAVATAKTAATAIAGPLAGAATAAVVMGRAAEAASYAFCRECREAMRGGGVVWCCLDCFLEGDNLSLFAYSVPAWFYAASSNIGVIANRALQTCVEAAADPPEQVLSRANRLLDCNGFGIYDPVLNNCFDFAFYCKTCRRCDTPARQLPPARDRTTCMIM